MRYFERCISRMVSFAGGCMRLEMRSHAKPIALSLTASFTVLKVGCSDEKRDFATFYSMGQNHVVSKICHSNHCVGRVWLLGGDNLRSKAEVAESFVGLSLFFIGAEDWD